MESSNEDSNNYLKSLYLKILERVNIKVNDPTLCATIIEKGYFEKYIIYSKNEVKSHFSLA